MAMSSSGVSAPSSTGRMPASLRLEREQQQPDLVLLAGRAGGDEPRAGRVAHAVLQARAELAAQVGGEEVLLGDRAGDVLPALAELHEQRQDELRG